MPISATSSHILLLAITCYYQVFVASNLCLDRCGNLEIAYPFGIGDDCFHPGFEIRCVQSIPFLAQLNLSILSISEGEVSVDSTQFILTCEIERTLVKTSISLPRTGPYSLSINLNKFIAVGCGCAAFISQAPSSYNICILNCVDKNKIINSNCNGSGCCLTSLPSDGSSPPAIPPPMDNEVFDMALYCGLQRNNSTSYSPRAYGFIAEDGIYDFRISDLQRFSRNISMKLEWAIGEDNCSQAVHLNSSICGPNALCVDAKRGYGYLCECHEGYKGNPYLNGEKGCQGNADINEYGKGTNIHAPEVIWEDSTAGCNSSCPPQKSNNGDGGNKGSKGSEKAQLHPIILATVACVLFLIPCSAFVWLVQKKRTNKKLKAEYFQQNGGLLLQEHAYASQGASREPIMIFSSREIRNAISNYCPVRILGFGSKGTVYKGNLEDGSTVAVKKSYAMAQTNVQQFIDEIIVLTQVDHKSIAKLYGCCLETQVPYLVYEYVSGVPLYQLLLEAGNPSAPLSWKSRIDIAAEIAGALSHLHSCASVPIIHRDVNSSNILLSKNNEAKLVDFGVFRFIPNDRKWALTVMEGKAIYLDPEYFETGRLTEKSDVYSFGVVLVELLSGKTAIRHEKRQDYNTMVTNFLSCAGRGDFIRTLDQRIVKEGEMKDLQAMVEIAARCLSYKGEERPKMEEVVQELSLMAG